MPRTIEDKLNALLQRNGVTENETTRVWEVNAKTICQAKDSEPNCTAGTRQVRTLSSEYKCDWDALTETCRLGGWAMILNDEEIAKHQKLADRARQEWTEIKAVSQMIEQVEPLAELLGLKPAVVKDLFCNILRHKEVGNCSAHLEYPYVEWIQQISLKRRRQLCF